MSLAYHGNFCGPGWSDGKYQPSVDGTLDPIDEFDASCKQHDLAYYRHSVGDITDEDLDLADQKFSSSNYGKSLKRTIASAAVEMARKRRGKKKQAVKQAAKEIEKVVKQAVRPVQSRGQRGRAGGNASRVPMPVALGNRARPSVNHVVTVKNGGVHVKGTLFLSQIVTPGVSGGGFTGDNLYSQEIDLSNLSSTALKYYAALHQFWIPKKLQAEYVPACSTSVPGEIALCFVTDPDDPLFTGLSNVRGIASAKGVAINSTFLPAISTMPAAAKRRFYTRTQNSNERWSVPAIVKLIQVVPTGQTSLTIGSLYLHYEIDFTSPMTEITDPTDYALVKFDGTGASAGTPLGTGGFTSDPNADFRPAIGATSPATSNMITGSTTVLSGGTTYLAGNMNVGSGDYLMLTINGKNVLSAIGAPTVNANGCTIVSGNITVNDTATPKLLTAWYLLAVTNSAPTISLFTATGGLTAGGYISLTRLKSTAPITASLASTPFTVEDKLIELEKKLQELSTQQREDDVIVVRAPRVSGSGSTTPNNNRWADQC